MKVDDTITTRFENVKNQTTEEYFNGNKFSVDAFNEKYTAHEGETYVQAVKRVCDYIASVEETTELRKYWSERWFDEIYNDWWHPAGSIMQGAGVGRKISLANCFTRDTEFITDKGVKSFVEFNDGDKVNVLSNYGGFRESTVKCFGHQPICKLTLMRNGSYKEVHCTWNHSWRTLDKDTVVNKETSLLSPGDKLPYIKRKWMENQSGRYFCPIGFIHGLVYGDGYYYKDGDYCSLDLCGDSQQFIKYFQGFNWVVNKDDKNDRTRISYLPNYMKTLPEFNSVNSEYILGFLMGWFAADGTVENGRAILYHNDKDNLVKISKVVESLGIYATGGLQERRNTDTVKFGEKTYSNKQYTLYSISFVKDSMFESFFVKENHKRSYVDYLQSVKLDRTKTPWTVVSVEDMNIVEDVWCVIEPECHNFTLRGGISTNNCTHNSMGAISPNEEWDSLEGIIRNTGYTVAKCAAYRQGLGVDFSRLRPRGTKVLNSANESTGAVHWMKFMDGIGHFVGQKGRIPAMLFSLRCDHPDVEYFVTVKSDRRVIQNANISVQCTEKFYKAVEDDKEWELRFEIPAAKKGERVYVDAHSIDLSCKKDDQGRWYKITTHDRKKEVFTKMVSARDLMKLIAKNMHAHGEPGIQNIDLARKYSNSDAMYDPEDEYDSRIIGTNACSEQYLSRDSLCVLASANCGRFSTNHEVRVGQLMKIGKSMNRFLDNVNECEIQYQTYATPHQRLAIQKLRRTGGGITNIDGWLFKQNLQYGNQAANEAVEDFVKWLNYWMYVGSEEVGKEKGDFGLFKPEKWRKALFVSRLIEESKKMAEKYDVPVLTGAHARNVTCSSIAPTGTLSLMFRETVMSYGIEPAFFLGYWKRTRMIDQTYTYYFMVPTVVHQVFEREGHKIPMESDTIRDEWDGRHGKKILEFIEKYKNEVGIKFRESTEIDPMDKLEMMSQVMKWVDSSISVTYMLPEGSDWKAVYKFLVKSHEKEVKSIAAFPDKKMYGIVSKIPFRDLAFKLRDENIDIHPNLNFSNEELRELNLSKENIDHSPSKAPKRLTALDADIYVVNVKGEKFVIVVGLQNNEPYEIFGGHVNGFGFKFTSKKGKITKVKRGQYALEIDELVIEDFSKQFTPTEQILFRMASMGLRHGVPIQFVVDQLQKATDDITSMASAAARCLKKYIRDGLQVSGQKCPTCGNDLVYLEGCVSCTGCGYSKCS